MAAPSAPNAYIQACETLVRFYVLLAHHLDRLPGQRPAEAIGQEEFEGHLGGTKEEALKGVAVNPVVRQKLEKEYQAIFDLAQEYQKAGGKDPAAEKVKQMREQLQVKMIALSDLLAVFRAL